MILKIIGLIAIVYFVACVMTLVFVMCASAQ